MLEEALYRFLASKVGTFIRGGLDREQVLIALGQRGYFEVHDLELETGAVERYWRQDLGIKELQLQRAGLGTLSIQARWNGVISISIADVYLELCWYPGEAPSNNADSFQTTRAELLRLDDEEQRQSLESWARTLATREQQLSQETLPASSKHNGASTGGARDGGWLQTFAGRATAFLLRRLQLQIERVHIHVDFIAVEPETNLLEGRRSQGTRKSSCGLMLRQLSLIDSNAAASDKSTDPDYRHEWRPHLDHPTQNEAATSPRMRLILDRQLRVHGLACYLTPMRSQHRSQSTPADAAFTALAGESLSEHYERFAKIMEPFLLCRPSYGYVGLRIERPYPSTLATDTEAPHDSSGQSTSDSTTRVSLCLGVERWCLQLQQSQVETVTALKSYATWLGWRRRSDLLVLMNAPEPFLWMFGNRYRSRYLNWMPPPEERKSAELPRDIQALEATEQQHPSRARNRWKFALLCVRAFVSSLYRPFVLEDLVAWHRRKERYISLYTRVKLETDDRTQASTGTREALALSLANDPADLEEAVAALEQQLSIDEIRYFRSLAIQRYHRALERDPSRRAPLQPNAERPQYTPGANTKRSIVDQGRAVSAVVGSAEDASGTAETARTGATASTGWLGWISTTLGWSSAPPATKDSASGVDVTSGIPTPTARSTAAPAAREERHTAVERIWPATTDTLCQPSEHQPQADARSARLDSEQREESKIVVEPASLAQELGERFQGFVQEHVDEQVTDLESTLQQIQWKPDAAGLRIELRIDDTQMSLQLSDRRPFADIQLRHLHLLLERTPNRTCISLQTGDVVVQAREHLHDDLYPVVFVDASTDASSGALLRLAYEHQHPIRNTSWSGDAIALTAPARSHVETRHRMSVRSRPLVLLLSPALVRHVLAFGRRQNIPWRVWMQEAKAQFAAYRTSIAAALPDSETLLEAASTLDLDIMVSAPRIYVVANLAKGLGLIRERASPTSSEATAPVTSPRHRWIHVIERLRRGTRLDAFAVQVQLGRLSLRSGTCCQLRDPLRLFSDLDRVQQRLALKHRSGGCAAASSTGTSSRAMPENLAASHQPPLLYDVAVQQLSMSLELDADAAALFGCASVPILLPCGGSAHLALAYAAPAGSVWGSAAATAEASSSYSTHFSSSTTASVRLGCLIEISDIELHLTAALWQYAACWQRWWSLHQAARRVGRGAVAVSPKVSTLSTGAEMPTRSRASQRDEKVPGRSSRKPICPGNKSPAAGTTDATAATAAAAAATSTRTWQQTSPADAPRSVSWTKTETSLLLEMHWRGAHTKVVLCSPTDPPAQLVLASAGLDAALGLAYAGTAPIQWRLSFAADAPEAFVRQRIADQKPLVLLSPCSVGVRIHGHYTAVAASRGAPLLSVQVELQTSAFDAIFCRQDMDLWRSWLHRWSTRLNAPAYPELGDVLCDEAGAGTGSASAPKGHREATAVTSTAAAPGHTPASHTLVPDTNAAEGTGTGSFSAMPAGSGAFRLRSSAQAGVSSVPLLWDALAAVLGGALGAPAPSALSHRRRSGTQRHLSRAVPGQQQQQQQQQQQRSSFGNQRPVFSPRKCPAPGMSPQPGTLITLWDSATQLPCVLQADASIPIYVLALASTDAPPYSAASTAYSTFLVKRTDPDDETLFSLLAWCPDDSEGPSGVLRPVSVLPYPATEASALQRQANPIPAGVPGSSAEPPGRRRSTSSLRRAGTSVESARASAGDSTPRIGCLGRFSGHPDNTAPPTSVSDAGVSVGEPIIWRACFVSPDGFCLMNAHTGKFLSWNLQGQAIETSLPETVLRLGAPWQANASARKAEMTPETAPAAFSQTGMETAVSLQVRVTSAGVLVRLTDSPLTGNGNGNGSSSGGVLPLVALTMSQLALVYQVTDTYQELQTQCTFAVDAYDGGQDRYEPRLHPFRLQLRLHEHRPSGLLRIWLSPLHREPVRIQGSEQDALELALLWEYLTGRRAHLPTVYQRAYRFSNETDADLEIIIASNNGALMPASGNQKSGDKAHGPDAVHQMPSAPAAGKKSAPERPATSTTPEEHPARLGASGFCVAAGTVHAVLPVQSSWAPNALRRIQSRAQGSTQVTSSSASMKTLQLGVRALSIEGDTPTWFSWTRAGDALVASEASATETSARSLIGNRPSVAAALPGTRSAAAVTSTASSSSSSSKSGDARTAAQLSATSAHPLDAQQCTTVPPCSAQLLWERLHWRVTRCRTGWHFCLQAPITVHNACAHTTLRLRCLGQTSSRMPRTTTTTRSSSSGSSVGGRGSSGRDLSLVLETFHRLPPQKSIRIGALADIRALAVAFEETLTDSGANPASADATVWCESFSVQAAAMRALYGEAVTVAHMVHWCDNRVLRVSRHIHEDGSLEVWLAPVLEFRNLLPVPALITINEQIVCLEPRSRQELFRFPADGRCELAASIGEALLLEQRQPVARFQLSDREHVEPLRQTPTASTVALFSQLLDTRYGYVEASCYLGRLTRNATLLITAVYTVFNMVPGLTVQIQESGQMPEFERYQPHPVMLEPQQAGFLRTPCCRLFGWREPVRLELVTAQGYFLRLQGIPLVLSFASSYEAEQLERARWYEDVEGVPVKAPRNRRSTFDNTSGIGRARVFALRPELVLVNELTDTKLLVRRAHSPVDTDDAASTLEIAPGGLQPFLFPVYAGRDIEGNAITREKAPADSAALQIRLARKPLERQQQQRCTDAGVSPAGSKSLESSPRVETPLVWSGVLPLAITGSFVVDVADGLPGYLTVQAFLERNGCQVIRFQKTPANAVPFRLVNETPGLLCFTQAKDRVQALQLLADQRQRLTWALPRTSVGFAFCEPLAEHTLCVMRIDADPVQCFFLPSLEAAFLDASEEDPDTMAVPVPVPVPDPAADAHDNASDNEDAWIGSQRSMLQPESQQQAWQRRLVADTTGTGAPPAVLWVQMRATPTQRVLVFRADSTADAAEVPISEAFGGEEAPVLAPVGIQRLHLFVLVPELAIQVHATAAAGGARCQILLNNLQLAADVDVGMHTRTHVQVSLQRIELRNEEPTTPFPVVLHSGATAATGEDKSAASAELMALEAELVLRQRFGERECAPLRVLVAGVQLQLDAVLMAQLAALATACAHDWAVHHDAASESTSGDTADAASDRSGRSPIDDLVWMPKAGAGSPPRDGSRGISWLVLAYLQLTPVEVLLSFQRGRQTQISEAQLEAASLLARAAYLSTLERFASIPSIDQASLQLAGLELRRHALASPDELSAMVWTRWTRSILNQWYKLLGSLDVIGAPLTATRSPVTHLKEMYSNLMAGRSTARRFSYGAYSAVSAAERVSVETGKRVVAQPAAGAMARTAGALGLRLLARGLRRLGSGKTASPRARHLVRTQTHPGGIATEPSKASTETTLLDDEPVAATISATIDATVPAADSDSLIQWDDDESGTEEAATLALQSFAHNAVEALSPPSCVDADLRKLLLYPDS